MDRCALFVDAGYVLADGAMAVHGTRRRESVSWDYPGLLQLLASLATERSGLPLLRCYWYESTVEGRRSADHDALADLPGVKLRLARMRPGRREGVESEIRRDLTTLARNKAVSDVMVVSAEEDLAQVIADVQDMGMRVSLLHIAVDGNGTVPRALRQECDDVVEMSSGHLRPYVELISGAEPPRPDERDAPLAAQHTAANGTNGNGRGMAARAAAYASPAAAQANGGLSAQQAFTSGLAGSGDYQPPAARSYRDELGADWDEAAPGEPEAVQEQSARVEPVTVYRDAGPAPGPGQQVPAAPLYGPASVDFGYQADAAQDPGAAPEPSVVPDFAAPHRELPGVRQDPGQERPDVSPRRVPPVQAEPPMRPELPVRPDVVARPELYAAPVVVPGPAEQQIVDDAVPQPHGMTDLSGYNPGAVREQRPRELLTREPGAADVAELRQPVPVHSGQVRRLPTRGIQAGPAPLGPAAPGQAAGTGQPGLRPAPSGPQPVPPPVPQPLPQAGGAAPGQLSDGRPSGPQPVAAVLPIGQAAAGYAQPGTAVGGPLPAPPAGLAPLPGAGGPPGPMGSAALTGGQQPGPVGVPMPMPNPAMSPEPAGAQQDAGGAPAAAGQGLESSGPVGPVGPIGPVAYSAGQAGISLADAVQSAHEEGQEFGDSVARDAPALWLEAVLARKPRMPSDLEARLLQGSALPIDYLLHDEVRHALRRGFWDAMERARR